MGKAEIAAYAYQPGHPGGPGRPKGSRSKLQEIVLKALYEDFANNGVEAIERVRQRKPEVYLMACVSLLPKQAEKVQSPFVDVSDAELEALENHLAIVRAKMVQTIDATPNSEPATTPQPSSASILPNMDDTEDAQHALDLSPECNVDDAA